MIKLDENEAALAAKDACIRQSEEELERQKMRLVFTEGWLKESNQCGDELKLRIAHLQAGYARELEEVEQALGKALGYPYYYTDQVNFTGTTKEDGVFVGVHTAGTLAKLAAECITELSAELTKLRSERQAEIAELEATKVSLAAKGK